MINNACTHQLIYSYTTIILDKLYTFDFEAVDEDILGEAYEEVIKDVMTGKVLGQFFTPPKVKQMMIKLIKNSNSFLNHYLNLASKEFY